MCSEKHGRTKFAFSPKPWMISPQLTTFWQFLVHAAYFLLGFLDMAELQRLTLTNCLAFSLSLENHILEDVNKCVLALQEGDADSLDRTAGAIRGRAARVANVVTAEMSNYEPGIYTERVLEAVKVLRDQVMPNFAQRVEIAVEALSSNPSKDVDENEFIDASRLVYDGVREIRRAVLMNRVCCHIIIEPF